MSAKELRAKEDEDLRKKKELEEAKKREEAERLRTAIEIYEKECAEISKAKAEYITTEKLRIEENHNNVLVSLRTAYEAAYTQKENEIERIAIEKAHLEQALENAGLFEFGRKKQLRLDIESFTDKIRFLLNDKKQLDSDYEAAKHKENTTYESSMKVVAMNAGKKYKLPKDPRQKS